MLTLLDKAGGLDRDKGIPDDRLLVLAVRRENKQVKGDRTEQIFHQHVIIAVR